MSAEPPPKSPQLLPQLDKRPERQWPLPLTRQRPQTFLMGRAVSVSQSLPGLRSCQSQPHGCCQRSGYAASIPTRPAKSVLGGFATSSAPAFPSSCAAAPAAAAAVRGSEVDYHCAAIRDKAHHLRLFALNYISTIDVLTLLRINTDQCQSLLSTAIPSIVDNETIFDSPLRGN